jgi:hypothetical protein
MPTLDIPVSADLQKMFDLPSCPSISLPKPAPMKLTLPTGGELHAFADISKGIPTDCSMSFSLILQIAPFLASIECLVKVLGLLKPLIDIVKGLPVPPVKAVADFIEAAGKLLPCFGVLIGANIIPFIRDLLLLIISILNCLLGQLRTTLELMRGLSLQINAAQAAGNTELVQALQCAQENAQTSADHLTNSMGPIGNVLNLVQPLLELAGQGAIALPSLGSAQDTQALSDAVNKLQDVVSMLQQIVESLPG